MQNIWYAFNQSTSIRTPKFSSFVGDDVNRFTTWETNCLFIYEEGSVIDNLNLLICYWFRPITDLFWNNIHDLVRLEGPE